MPQPFRTHQHVEESWSTIASSWERDGYPFLTHVIESVSSAWPRKDWKVLVPEAERGSIALKLAERYYSVECCDDSVSTALTATVRRGSEQGFAIAARTAAVRTLPYESGSFDAAVWSLDGMFVPPRLGAGLTELRRVLRPGGRLALLVWMSPIGPCGEGNGLPSFSNTLDDDEILQAYSDAVTMFFSSDSMKWLDFCAMAPNERVAVQTHTLATWKAPIGWNSKTAAQVRGQMLSSLEAALPHEAILVSSHVLAYAARKEQ